jgi:hypothetical protein
VTTTTPAAIIAKLVTVIEALSPQPEPLGRTFRRLKQPQSQRLTLRKWSLTSGAGVFRIFDVVRAGEREDLGVQDPRATLARVPLLVTLAYPASPSLCGLSEYGELEDLIDADACQVRNAIYSVSALADGGHQASDVTIRAPDRDGDQAWFQDLAVVATFYVAQTFA